jgi:uncharacterized protein YggE
MKHRIIAALAALALIAVNGSIANAQTPPVNHRIATMTVTGTASVTRAPDRATISFRIETTNDQSAAATSANNAIVAALGKRLAGMNVPAGAISTQGYSLNYTPRPPKPDPQSTQRYGYSVERTINVAIDNVDGAGAIVDAGMAAGVTNVNGISFSLRDQHAALRSAQTAALADAVAQAKDLATAANMRLVAILAISPGGGSSPVRPMARSMVAAVAAAPTVIDPGSLTVDANVTIQYEIAPLKP